ncbi:single-stranded-DNA-specific exonuclease RecJ [Helicobacter himalayensis]|uniref:single-stranded-DNA-specific exonuclease RecJ n=1 Tax=Helicobacter himalayensis TaxID=1591088 RepID=UPI000831ACDC|nr:single-stranded-DNA-specific exonuclease RecJ [Helicobacter himalayensis]
MLTPQLVEEILESRDTTQGIASLKDLPQPHLLKGVGDGAKIVSKVMREKGKILIVGDYDADGVNASAVMSVFFDKINYTNYEIILPNRFSDGYGISPNLLERINAPQNFALVVSVDNGISAFSAAEYCKEHNLPLIITDHHTPHTTLPCAQCVINPKQEGCAFPFKDICGCVVAWYFCAGIKQELQANIDMGAFLPFLALATLADVMPLVGVNRILVKKGLEFLQSARFGFCEVICQKVSVINAENIAFSLIPLLNCAGRMGDANLALDFLLAKTQASASKAYNKLCKINAQRKLVQQEILSQAQQNLTQLPDVLYASGEEWHRGVIGIIASQLAQMHKKCAFVLSTECDDGILKGSARSFGKVDLIKTAQKVQEIKPLLKEFGGHSGALGLSLDSKNLQEFMELFSEYLCLGENAQESVLGEISSQYLDLEFLKMLERFEPFGEGNPTPFFLCRDLELIESKIIGKTKEHLGLKFLSSKGAQINGIEFFSSEVPKEKNEWIFSLSKDTFCNCPCLKIKKD